MRPYIPNVDVLLTDDKKTSNLIFVVVFLQNYFSSTATNNFTNVIVPIQVSNYWRKTGPVKQVREFRKIWGSVIGKINRGRKEVNSNKGPGLRKN